MQPNSWFEAFTHSNLVTDWDTGTHWGEEPLGDFNVVSSIGIVHRQACEAGDGVLQCYGQHWGRGLQFACGTEAKQASDGECFKQLFAYHV